MSKFWEQLATFSSWIGVRKATSFPENHLVYLVRVVDENGDPVQISRARKVDHTGIIYVGSGLGSNRLAELKSGRHHLMLWWDKFDFDSLPGFGERNLEVAWLVVDKKEAAMNLESELLLAYKVEYADIPIGNLKTW